MDYTRVTPEPLVALVPMSQQAEVRKSDDDWTGITSAAERRKLQNRLNQRAYHKRKRRLRQNGSSGARPPADTAIESDIEVNNVDTSITTDSHVFSVDSNSIDSKAVSRTCSSTSPGRQYLIRQFAEQAYNSYVRNSPCLTHLPTLLRLNSFVAVNQNAWALNMSTEWLDGDAISPFGHTGAAPGLTTMLPTCPSSLQPTPLQLAIEHHPWIDVLPCPILRDNVLQAAEVLGLIDEDDLCHDIVEPGDGLGRSAFIVWGNPWETSGWEVTPEFICKWGGLLRGCQELLAATNSWREKRGERRLIVEV